jgi:hypothetical protein
MSRLQKIEIDNKVFDISTLTYNDIAFKINKAVLEENRKICGYGEVSLIYVDNVIFNFIGKRLFYVQFIEEDNDNTSRIYLIDNENNRVDLKDKSSLISMLYEPEFNKEGAGKFGEFKVFSNVKCRLEKLNGHNHFYYYILENDDIFSMLINAVIGE